MGEYKPGKSSLDMIIGAGIGKDDKGHTVETKV